MPTALEEFNKLKAMVAAGRGEERVTPAIAVRRSIAERVANKPKPGKKPRTTFVFPTESAACYSELNKWKDRVIHYAQNKAIGTELLIRAWRELAQNPALVRKWIEEGRLEPPF
jgi:hypothetical protein